MNVSEIRETLFSLADEKYRRFTLSLIPSITEDRVIGVRMPILRNLAKEMRKSDSARLYMLNIPHFYQEENLLHVLLLNGERDLDVLYLSLDRFLPCIDNWAVSDSLRPRALGDDKGRLYAACLAWLAHPHPYTVRFGIDMLLCFFLDDDFSPEVLHAVASVKREEYYIKMMQAWFFAEAAVRQYAAALPFFTERRLSDEVHKMAVRKICDSLRVDRETKLLLRKTL